MTLASQPKWWSKLSLREKVLCGVTLGAVCYLFFVSLYLPRVAERKRLSSQEESLRMEITRLTATLGVLRKRTPRSGAMTQIQDADLIDSGSRLSKLLHKIHKQARGQGVEILEIKQKVLENKASYRILPLELKARSRFRDLGLYLLSLEGFSDPVVIDRIIIRSDLETNPEVVAELTLHIYRRGEA